MRTPRRDPALAALSAAGGATALLLPHGSPARVIAGVVLVLLLPGAALAGSVLDRGERAPEEVLVGLGASAGVIALAAIVLDVLDVPLSSTTWIVALVAITWLALTIGRVRTVRE